MVSERAAGSRRWLRPTLWVAVAGVLALAVSLPLVLPGLVEFGIRRALQARGVADVALGEVRVDLRGVTLDDLRLGANDELRLSRIRTTWSLRDLLGGRLSQVSIEGLELRAWLTADATCCWV